MFANKWPALFLKVTYPPGLTEFRQQLETSPLKPSNENLPFHPHVAVAELTYDQLTTVKSKEKELEKLFESISWTIPLVVGVYGKPGSV